MPGDITTGGRPPRDLALYQPLISDGIAAADRRGCAVDHVTARRMSLTLVSRSREPAFMRGLIRFARTGAITQELKARLRHYARSPGHPHQPQAARLLEHAAARGTNLGPIGIDFGGACDQIGHADAMLTELHGRIRENRALPERPRPDSGAR